MKKQMVGVCLAGIMLLSALSGCASSPKNQESSTPEHVYTFTDDLGREVTVDHPQRVAALLGSYADLWVLAGGELCAATDDAWEDFDLPLDEDTVNLGVLKQLSLEALLSSRPDFVLASSNTTQHLEWKEALEGAGISVAYFDVAEFEDYLHMLKICTDITGDSQSYQTNGVEVQEQVEGVLQRSREEMDPDDPQTVLVLRTSSSSVRAKNSQGTVLGEMLAKLGCINIADQDGSLLEDLSMEGILAANPDKIFVVTMGDNEEAAYANLESTLASNPLWQQLDAVQEGHVYYMDRHLYNMKPNDQWGEAYAHLEELLFQD